MESMLYSEMSVLSGYPVPGAVAGREKIQGAGNSLRRPPCQDRTIGVELDAEDGCGFVWTSYGKDFALDGQVSCDQSLGGQDRVGQVAEVCPALPLAAMFGPEYHSEKRLRFLHGVVSFADVFQ